MRRIYIAGPMSGLPFFNFPAFDAAEKRWRDWGWQVASPAQHDRKQGLREGQFPTGDVNALLAISPNFLREAMGWDLAEVMCSQAIALLPGWCMSKGAVAEAALARVLGLRAYNAETGDRVNLDAIFGGLTKSQATTTFRGYQQPVIGLSMPKAAAQELAPGSIVSVPDASYRTFASGATRDSDENKPDYEGYLSPLVIHRFGRYMLQHSKLPDGTRRASDNWQKGMPRSAYLESLWRHMLDVWLHHRNFGLVAREALEEALCGLLFNVQGYLHTVLSERPSAEQKERVA